MSSLYFLYGKSKVGGNMIFTLLSVFAMKFADCSLSTLKTVFLVKNKFFISSIMNSLAAALFIFVADAMANAPSDQKMAIAAVVFLANLTGGYIPPKFVERIEKDKLFVYLITASNLESGKELADDLRAHNIPVCTNVSYNTDMEKSLNIKAFAQSKEQSRIITKRLTEDVKWHIMEAI